MSVSCESVDKNYNLGLRGPKPPGGPQGAQEPKSAPQKWASRARVVEKTRKMKILTKNEEVDFALQHTANLSRIRIFHSRKNRENGRLVRECSKKLT